MGRKKGPTALTKTRLQQRDRRRKDRQRKKDAKKKEKDARQAQRKKELAEAQKARQQALDDRPTQAGKKKKTAAAEGDKKIKHRRRYTELQEEVFVHLVRFFMEKKTAEHEKVHGPPATELINERFKTASIEEAKKVWPNTYSTLCRSMFTRFEEKVQARDALRNSTAEKEASSAHPVYVERLKYMAKKGILWSVTYATISLRCYREALIARDLCDRYKDLPELGRTAVYKLMQELKLHKMAIIRDVKEVDWPAVTLRLQMELSYLRKHFAVPAELMFNIDETAVKGWPDTKHAWVTYAPGACCRPRAQA